MGFQTRSAVRLTVQSLGGGDWSLPGKDDYALARDKRFVTRNTI